MQNTQVKRGATFALAGVLTLPTGTWSASADVGKADGSTISALDVTLTAITPDADGNNHSLTLGKNATVTATWPIGRWFADIRFADGNGVVLYTTTFGVDVVLEITNG